MRHRSPSGSRPTGCPAAGGRAARAGRSAAPRPRACPAARQRQAEQRQTQQPADRKQHVRDQGQAAQREHAGHADEQPPSHDDEHPVDEQPVGHGRFETSRPLLAPTGTGPGCRCGCLPLASPFASPFASARSPVRDRHLAFPFCKVSWRWINPGNDAGSRVAHTMFSEVVADELADHLRRRAVLARAQSLERHLLVRIDQQRQPCGLQLHDPRPSDSATCIECTSYAHCM